MFRVFSLLSTYMHFKKLLHSRKTPPLYSATLAFKNKLFLALNLLLGSFWGAKLTIQLLYKLYIHTPDFKLNVVDLWAWKDRKCVLLCENSPTEFNSYTTDIKRQTNFPPKLGWHDKRFLHWNVHLSSWGSVLSFRFTVNTDTSLF